MYTCKSPSPAKSPAVAASKNSCGGARGTNRIIAYQAYRMGHTINHIINHPSTKMHCGSSLTQSPPFTPRPKERKLADKKRNSLGDNVPESNKKNPENSVIPARSIHLSSQRVQRSIG